MVNALHSKERRTSVDQIFEHLYNEIAHLHLLPGEKISEAEIATQFGVSRQPVRDAFNRLEGMDLLLIRPQRATEVRRFSIREITKSRFVRAAVESKVLQQAAELCDAKGGMMLDACIDAQRDVIANGDYSAFGVQDYQFHKTLCDIGNADFAFEVISSEKANVDRLCRLSFEKETRMPQLLEDHIAIAEAVKAGDPQEAVRAGMEHLSHLDSTIAAVSTAHARYFEA